MVNALGSGALETRAVMAFLSRISEVLTGVRLKLRNIAIWWCGAEAESDNVRDNAERMMISPAHAVDLQFDLSAATAIGGNFRGTARASIDEWIAAEAVHLVGQEAVTLSTTPTSRCSAAAGWRICGSWPTGRCRA